VALLALWLVPARPSPSALRAFWLLLGLALAHHYMSAAVLLPAFAWLLFRERSSVRWRDAWLTLPGVALYAYLPIRWAQQPGLAWGDFGSWHDFWFNFFRIQYAAGELTRSPFTSLAQGLHALKLCLVEGSGILLPAALLGYWLGRHRPRTQALGLAWLTALAAVTFYLNLKPERLDLMRPYLFPAYLAQAWLAVDGFAALAGRLKASTLRAACLGGLCAVGAVAALRWPSQSLASYYFAEDNARDILRNLPKDSLLLAQGDALIFPLWYLQRVRHERPDVAVVGLAVLPMEWVRRDLARMHPDLRHPRVTGPIGAESVPALTQAYLVLNPQRPRYSTFNRFDPPLPAWTLASEGLVWRAEPAGLAPPADAAPTQKLQAAGLRGFLDRPLDERTLTLVVGDRAVAYNSLGVAAEEAHDYARAADRYRQAAAIHPEDPDYPFNQGNAWHALGHVDWAETAYRKAVAVDPGYVAGWYNLAVVLYQTGRGSEAKAAFGQVLRLDPTRSDVRQIMAGIPD
jgi:tetratricopeptide (TPR) repeat protein